MTTDAYEDSNFEELLLSNDFYSSNTPASHMTSFRDSIQLKNSLSPTSIHKGAGETEKTNIMKNSPSMKALEKILNEKSKNRHEENTSVIVEEDEEEYEEKQGDQREGKGRRSILIKDITDNMNCVSKDSESSGQYSDARTHTTESDSTFSTREPGEYVYDETIDGEDTDGSHYKGEAKAYIKQTAELDYSNSKTPEDQDDTLIEESSPNSKGDTTKKPEAEEPKINSILQSYIPKSSSMIPDNITVPTNSKASKEKDLPPINKSPGQSTQGKPEVITPPPHIRSNSTFSLSFKKDKEEQPVTRHKRSSTLGDLSAIGNSSKDTTAPKEKKKFSFKSLFKSKSKARTSERLHQDEYSEPKKLNAKSFSTPNISRFNNNSSIVSETGQSQDSIDDKKSGETNAGETNAGEKIPRENTLLNVFKKNKSVDGFTITEKSEDKGSKKNRRMSTWIDSNFINSSKPSDSKNIPSHVNLIREVNDEQVGSEHAYSNREEDAYDSKNLSIDPPTKINNTRFGDEMELMPTISPEIKVEDKPFSFDSPSPINHNKEDQMLKVPNSSKELHDISNHDINSNNDTESKPNNQLLGEALFPKSLNQQEVESIVSLERSRSIRSIKSNKRNSFVNYNGSDENIIVYNGDVSTPSKGISRSGSILKNSKISLNVNDESNIMNIDNALQTKIEANDNGPINNTENEDIFENYEEFLEFSDFIDFDHLSFSTSPKQATDIREVKLVENNSNQIDPSFIITYEEPIDVQNIPEKSITSISQEPQQQHEEITLANTPLTPNLEVIDSMKLPSSPESPEINRKSPDLSYNNTPVLNERGNNTLGNRPISMSFKGLRGPSFGNTLAQHDIRNSDSHQSFNLSFGEDDTDYSSSLVGGGYGSSEDDEDDDEDDNDSEFSNENKENQYNTSNQRLLSQPKKKFGSNNGANISSTLTPPKKFMHNKMPSFSDGSSMSSPISVSSVSSRRGYNVSRSPINVRIIRDLGNEVRFSSRIILYDTYSCDEYDRHPDTGTCNQLTPFLAQQIREELNELKSTMSVHEDSRCFTHFL